MGKNYEQLSCEERTAIQFRLEQGCTLREMARSVERSPSTISRELKRNGWINPALRPKTRGRPALAKGQVGTSAHSFAAAIDHFTQRQQQSGRLAVLTIARPINIRLNQDGVLDVFLANRDRA